MYSSMYKGEDQGTTVKESSRPACSKTRWVVLSKAFISLCLSSILLFFSDVLLLFLLGLEVLGSFLCSGGSCGPVGLDDHRFGLYQEVEELVVDCSDGYQFSDTVLFTVGLLMS
jgi:hypothetical protein